MLKAELKHWLLLSAAVMREIAQFYSLPKLYAVFKIVFGWRGSTAGRHLVVHKYNLKSDFKKINF